MPSRLRREDVVAIEVLDEKGEPKQEIARTLGVSEGTVRYHLRRRAAGAVDGRAKPFAAEAFAGPISTWVAAHAKDARPVNTRELHEHLVTEHGYGYSYKSVLRFVRARYPRPRIRTYRRVETPPGAQSQTDWGEFPRVDVGEGPETAARDARPAAACSGRTRLPFPPGDSVAER